MRLEGAAGRDDRGADREQDQPVQDQLVPPAFGHQDRAESAAGEAVAERVQSGRGTPPGGGHVVIVSHESSVCRVCGGEGWLDAEFGRVACYRCP